MRPSFTLVASSKTSLTEKLEVTRTDIAFVFIS